ncbi:MAG: GNAT family N-acetyltransferase [Cyclobacteriaceae bacterium]
MQEKTITHSWTVSQLYDAFVGVYADYPVKFRPTPEEFRIRLTKLNLDTARSIAYKNGDDIIGFILYTINNYQGKMTAYNGGTGVMPPYRGKGIIDFLFDQSMEELSMAGANRILLEVISTNQYAIKLYERLDFGYIRTLKSFKKKKTYTPPVPTVLLKKAKTLKAEYKGFKDFETSFIDSDNQLPFNLSNELLFEAYIQHELAGYIIYQPHVGRISQIAVDNKHRGKKVARALLRHAELTSARPLTILNIPENEQETIAALEALGFENELDQYEMEYLI